MTTQKDWCPKAVIFDMDGLLVDSEPVWASCERGILELRGKRWDAITQSQFIGLRMRDSAAGIIAAYGLTETVEELTEAIVTCMVECVHTAPIRPGAGELLDYLHKRGVPCSLASGSPRVIIEAVVAGQKWERYFPIRISGDEVPNGKPSPDIYLKAAELMGAAPADCLALEDSPNGARAAVAAAMTCYAVPDLSHTQWSAFKTITPYVFESLHDVLAPLARAGC
jgi:HAD superfamily hydrolase (TIGR01509 family)